MGVFSVVISLLTTIQFMSNYSTFALVPFFNYIMLGYVTNVYYMNVFDNPDIDNNTKCFVSLYHGWPEHINLTRYNDIYHESNSYDVCDYAERMLQLHKHVLLWGIYSKDPKVKKYNNRIAGIEYAYAFSKFSGQPYE